MHSATIWQVALDTDPSFTSPVFELFTTTFLTEIPSITGLDPNTNYLIRAAHIDNLGESSGFGPATTFTTLGSNTLPQPSLTEWEPCA